MPYCRGGRREEGSRYDDVGFLAGPDNECHRRRAINHPLHPDSLPPPSPLGGRHLADYPGNDPQRFGLA